MTLTKQIGVPAAYFKRAATTDYTNYRSALAREFLQNSADAGSKTVEFILDHQTRTLKVIDDGCGMDEDTVLNKLLVLGGSFKPETCNSNIVGGFGKAKELLFFSWETYEIKTRNILVSGEASYYELVVLPESEAIIGTQATILFPQDENLDHLEYYIINQLKTNQTSCKVIFNGKEIEPLKKGRFIRDVYYTETENNPENNETLFAKLYLIKSKQDSDAYIRLKGICMFRRRVSDSNKGQIVVELEGNSVELLTSNRDGLIYKVQHILDKLMHEIIIDCNSALRERAPIIEIYKGSGLVSSEASNSSIKYNHHLNSIVLATQVVDNQIDKASDLDELINAINSNAKIKNLLQGLSDKVKANYSETSVLEAKQEIKKSLQALNYKPDFIVKRRDKLIKALNPETWTPVNLKLAILWENAIKRVLRDCNQELNFSVGWTVDDPTVFAELLTLNNSSKAFLLNPNSPYLRGKGWTYLVSELVDLAVHEVTHLNHNYHDEVFVQAYEANRRACRDTDFSSIMKEAIKAL